MFVDATPRYEYVIIVFGFFFINGIKLVRRSYSKNQEDHIVKIKCF